MARPKKRRISGSSQPPSSDAVPGTIAAAAVRTVWSFPRWIRVVVLSAVVFVGAVFALWTSLPNETKKDVLSRVGFGPTPGNPSPEVQSRASSFSHEIESLIRFYNNRAKNLERKMTLTAVWWRLTGPIDPSHEGWQESIAMLEEKRLQFRELHQQHIEALRAGQLTLAQVYANSINELFGVHVFYDKEPPVREFNSFRSLYQSDKSTATGKLDVRSSQVS